MKKRKNPFQGLHTFLILWSTQMLSALGSSMTSFALIVWSYQQQGSALTTSLLSVCSYAPYVILSIFAGAFSDRWNKKYTMLACDSFAALTTVITLFLLKSGALEIWHLYLLNALNGLMNTVQQPATEVAVSLLAPKEQYQKVSGMRAFSNSLVTLLSPVFATAVLSFAGLEAVIAVDLCTFAAAFIALAFFIRIPQMRCDDTAKKETVFRLVRSGLGFLRQNRGILDLILFLAAINLIASVYNAALPAMVLSKSGGGDRALGFVTSCTGLANLAGSLIASCLHPPKSRVRVICGSLFFAMGTENLILALGKSTPVWCIGAVLGWLFIPLMNANMDVLFRTNIPLKLQGRVYAARNTFQFFTIPAGYLLGGVLVDQVFEPFMSVQPQGSIFSFLFGIGKGSGAAFLFGVLAVAGVLVCLIFSKDKHIWALEEKTVQKDNIDADERK